MFHHISEQHQILQIEIISQLKEIQMLIQDNLVGLNQIVNTTLFIITHTHTTQMQLKPNMHQIQHFL